MTTTLVPSSLPALERAILQATALYFVPIRRTRLMEVVRTIGARLPNGRAINHAGYKKALDGLLAKGWLEDGKDGLLCAPGVIDIMTDDLLADGRLNDIAAAVAADSYQGRRWAGQRYYSSYREALRDLRIALFRQDIDEANLVLATMFSRFPQEANEDYPLDVIDGRGIHAPWLAKLPVEVREAILLLLAEQGVGRLVMRPGMMEALLEGEWTSDEQLKTMLYRFSEYSLLGGLPGPVAAAIGDDSSTPALTLKAWAALVAGDLPAARDGYEHAYQALRKGTRKRNIGFGDVAGVFSALPLLAAGEFSVVRERAVPASKEKGNRLSCIQPLLIQLVDKRLGSDANTACDVPPIPLQYYQGPVHLLMLLLIYWIEPQLSERAITNLEAIIERASLGGFDWVAGQARALLARARGEQPPTEVGLALVDLLVRKDPWEFTLDALAAVGDDGSDHAATNTDDDPGDERLVWWLSLGMPGSSPSWLDIEPRIQKRSKRGAWTKGRHVALERLSRGLLDCIDPADRRLCDAIGVDHDPWSWDKDRYSFIPDLAWPALVGHPRLFRADDPGIALELVESEPELQVHRDGDRLRVAMQPPLPEDLSVSVVEETRSRWRLVRFNDAQRRIGVLIEDGLECPADAEERLRQTLGQVAPLVNIQSDIGGNDQLPQIPADPRIHLALTPLGDGLSAEMLVRPLGADGPGYSPGVGGTELTTAMSAGERYRVCRDLDAERGRADALTEACPVLAGAQVETCQWELPDPYSSLELLEQLQAFNEPPDAAANDPGETREDGSTDPAADEHPVVLEWPQGQKLRIAGRADSGSMSIALRKRGEWFEASGELAIDERQVIDLQRLLALVADSGDRFLPLGDGRFLALTDSFRRRLDDLRQLADSGSRKPRYHPLTAPLLEEIGAGLGEFATDQAWQQRVARLQDADAKPAPIPSTLSAELRDYQVDGYHWLMRLAGWGVGACLADDMGLGKTVQTLALLIERAPQGPSLVLAPTSVANNWLTETQRFAPTLNPVLFGPGDRQAQLDALGPFDLLIASYGLLQTEIKRFAAREDWNCLVLDEAQAIKNPATQRSKAVFRLQADFRIATTGTPIENHLGELWSLFRFLNPGLLGSRQAFNKRYAGPIERDDDHDARDRLRRLVRPFILRRLKSAVLDELPPRTEIVLQVEPGVDEVAFYEALRRQAVEQLDGSDVGDEKQRFQVLAAITRLRRAACNPALVAPEAGIASAKLALFLETVDELREGRHKALVFSQFVDHLSLVRAALDERGIEYQYLDGATPAATRAERVRAFQAGEGDLFLISLRAGGTGLNLTAADYVIHLDPWWNPAVEDQASDRAHRIGQQRPVTVYRLVAKGSIEEHIIQLHGRKRGLADGLLEGGDAAARLDTNEMLALIRDAGAG